MVSPTSNHDRHSLYDEQSALNQNDATKSVAFHKQQTSSAVSSRMLMLAAACSLSFFTFGYHCIVLNGPGVVIEAWINASYAQRDYIVNGDVTTPGLSSKTIRFMYAMTTGLLSAGAMIGAMFAGSIADRIGRRSSQVIVGSVAFLGAIVSGLSGYTNFPEMLMCGRVLSGLATGAATVVAPLYLSESSPLAIRGSLTTLTQMCGATSLFLAQILGLPDILGTKQLWPWLFFVSAIPPVVQIILTLLSPESPSYLCITKRQKLEAKDALKKLRSLAEFESGCVDAELLLYEHEAKLSQSMPVVKLSHLFADRKYLWPMSVALALQIAQNWSGVSGIVGYSNILFQQPGVAAKLASFASLLIGFSSIITSVVLIILIDRVGRRALQLGGMAGMIVMGVAISLSAILTKAYPVSAVNTPILKVLNHVNIAFILIFLIFFGLGPVSIPRTMVPELFAQEARGPATSFCCFVNWFNSFVIYVSFPLLERTLGTYIFVPFVVIHCVFFVFLARYLPETKGKTDEEVTAIFERY